MVTLVNFPDDHAPIPLEVTVSIDLEGRTATAARRGPSGKLVELTQRGGRVEVTIPLEMFETIVVEHGS